jgi:beta-galactosidase
MKRSFIFLVFILSVNSLAAQARELVDFNKGWKFYLGNDSAASRPSYNDSKWRTLQLPHDWSIEGSFSNQHNTTFNEAALPAGIGWYRKTFLIPAVSKDKRVFINFDGIYKNSEVWINGHFLGKRPNGYISFRYELTDYLNFGNGSNVIAVKVDNSAQPDSRWYTGSGIYRKAWLLTTNKIAVDQWGTFVTTPVVENNNALVRIETVINNASHKTQKVTIENEIIDIDGEVVADQVTIGVSLTILLPG